jgi:hypothetical protein
VGATEVAQLDAATADLDRGRLAERSIGRIDDDLGHFAGDVRDRLRDRGSTPLPELEEAWAAALVAPDRRGSEHVVAEGVVGVPVRIDHDRDRVRRQLAQVFEDLERLAVAASGIDDERFAIAEHDPDLLVEDRVSPREDSVTELDPGTRTRSHASDRSGRRSPSPRHPSPRHLRRRTLEA